VINVTQLLAVDKDLLLQRVGHLPPFKLHELEDSLRLVLAS
jgi:mRNA-degrading endonuclease toxin of MazEF toxin-antitoxin module